MVIKSTLETMLLVELLLPVGTGFINGSFSRWWTTAATGTTITAGSDPTGTLSEYPFINSNGSSRALYITRSSSTTTKYCWIFNSCI